jgi:uncharacterized protein YbjT (DUF2867 family)
MTTQSGSPAAAERSASTSFAPARRGARGASAHPSQRESENGTAHVIGDLLTGEGIDPAVAGIDSIVHRAGTFKDAVKMTPTRVLVASRAGAPHIVSSVVRTDSIPFVGFGRLAVLSSRTKQDAERVVAESRLPWTTLSATQFFDLFLTTPGVRPRLDRW